MWTTRPSGILNRGTTVQPESAPTSTTKLGDLAAFNKKQWSGETAQESIREISHTVKALVETIEREENKARPDAVARLREGLKGKNGLSDAVAARVESLLDLFEAEAKLAATLSEKNIPGMKNFPPEELWQLFIDRNLDTERDVFVFENERGYMAGMMNGFREMLDTLHKPLDAEGYRKLHDTCVHNVFSEPVDNQPEQRMDKGFREGGYMVSFGVVFSEKADPDHTFTKAGCEELLGKSNEELAVVHLQEDEQLTDVPTLDWTQIADRRLYGTNEVNEHMPWNLLGVNENDQFTSFVCAPRSQDECAKRARQILEAYYDQIDTAKTAEGEDDKLRAIVRCCRDLDQSHLFSDGNIRTIAFILLNKFLLENGMRPAIMVEPNAFDGYALHELVAEVKEGQEYVERLCRDQNPPSPEEAQALLKGKA